MLGYVGGVLITLGMAIIVLYTSYVCWQFCMAYVLSDFLLTPAIQKCGTCAILDVFSSADQKSPMN